MNRVCINVCIFYIIPTAIVIIGNMIMELYMDDEFHETGGVRVGEEGIIIAAMTPGLNIVLAACVLLIGLIALCEKLIGKSG